MGKSLNVCNFSGNAGRDCVVQYLQESGQAICSTGLAVGVWDSETKAEKTMWVELVFFGKLAEVAGKFITKGKQLFVTGRLSEREYVNPNDGQVKHKLDLVVSDFALGGERSGDSGMVAGRKVGGKPAQAAAQDEYDIGDVDGDPLSDEELGSPIDLDTAEGQAQLGVGGRETNPFKGRG